MDKTLQSWIEGFPYAKAKAELAALEAQKREIDLKVDDLAEMIAFYERHQPVGVADDLILRVEANGHAPRPRTHAASVLSLLEEKPGRSFTLRALNEEFARRGWFRPEVKNGIEILGGVMRKVVKENPNVRQVADNPISYVYRLRNEVTP